MLIVNSLNHCNIKTFFAIFIILYKLFAYLQQNRSPILKKIYIKIFSFWNQAQLYNSCMVNFKYTQNKYKIPPLMWAIKNTCDSNFVVFHFEGVSQQRCKVQTRLQGLFTFWHYRQREKKPQEPYARSELDDRKLHNARINSALLFLPLVLTSEGSVLLYGNCK